MNASSFITFFTDNVFLMMSFIYVTPLLLVFPASQFQSHWRTRYKTTIKMMKTLNVVSRCNKKVMLIMVKVCL